jgi:hypothetical protein
MRHARPTSALPIGLLALAVLVPAATARREDPNLLHVITPVLDDKSEIVRYEASATVLRLSGKAAE